MARFDLTDFEWSAIEPRLPTDWRGRGAGSMIAASSTASSGGCAPVRHGPTSRRAMAPHTTCVNRFNRWRKRGIWARLLEADVDPVVTVELALGGARWAA